MAMASSNSNRCFLLLTLNLSLSVCSSTTTSVYEILPKYGLPSGLLPDSVTNYTLSDDGRFEVSLEKACYIEFQYLVYYDKKISGKLSIGSITELEGIEVQRFYFLWFNVDEIRVDLPPSNSIYFKVGIINKELDVHQFTRVRSCKDKPARLLQLHQVVTDIPPILLTE